MRRLTRLAAIISVVYCISLFLSSSARSEEPNRANISLVSETGQIEDGPFHIGIHFQMEPGWYIYWENPGDAGIPVEAEWSAPEGLGISRLKHPVPERFDTQGLTSFGYKNEAVLLAEIDLPPDYNPSPGDALTVNASWMVCRESCYVENGSATLDLNAPAVDADLLHEYKRRLPAPIGASAVRITSVERSRGERDLEVTIRYEGGRVTDFYPGPVDDFILPHDRIRVTDDSVSLFLRPYSAASTLERISGLFFIDGEAYHFSEQISD
jgi:DsbC/DsbD-like thiol-disulfide interchange protein